MAELTNALRRRSQFGHLNRKVLRLLDAVVTLGILAVFGVLSILLFALRGFLDQLPEVFVSLGRARDAWRDFKQARTEEAQR
ncbi:hypothetical protein ACFXPQ_02200 [Streptomyces lydicus]|uniref:hypothetical protein n=1 Tax=Streptomyces lydicus TaxID=47763 RepID=UPI0036B8D845